MNRKTLGIVAGLAAGAVIGGAVMFGGFASANTIVVYKDPNCGCCGAWAEHLKRRGFDVAVRERTDMDSFKAENGVPKALESCHTAIVAGYVIEGHVPAADIRRLLEEKPAARGLAVPGMPSGSPGMENGSRDPYQVVLFGDNGARQVYSRH